MSAMARTLGADPAGMTCSDAEDLVDYLAASERSRDKRLGSSLVDERLW
jgi:hypothetical protein